MLFAGESNFSPSIYSASEKPYTKIGEWLVQDSEVHEDTIDFPIDFPPEIIEEDISSEDFLSEIPEPKKRSVPRAMLYSLILPGTGQL